MTVKLFQQIGILDDSLNNTEKLANVRDRGEKPLFVFVITKVRKKTPNGSYWSTFSSLNLHPDSKRFVGIDLGVSRRAGWLKTKSALTKQAISKYLPGFLDDLGEAVSISHACWAVWFLSFSNDDHKIGNQSSLWRKTCNDIGQAESKWTNTNSVQCYTMLSETQRDS